MPKSRAWLLASVTQRTPRSVSASTATGGARKKLGLAGSGHGSPPSDSPRRSRISCPADHPVVDQVVGQLGQAPGREGQDMFQPVER